jgi:hypothetical protein
METLQKDDVPYGDDWDSAAVVVDWAKAADQKQPWRSRIRDHIAGIVARLPQPTRVGSGPGESIKDWAGVAPDEAAEVVPRGRSPLTVVHISGAGDCGAERVRNRQSKS